MNTLRIGYFGDGPWSHRALTRLLADEALQIAFVCARNDAPDPVLKSMAAENALDFLSHPAINSAEFVDRMKRYRCDLFASLSFNQIFRRELMSLPPLRTVNCHAGKLPFYRGRNVLNWALINDEKEFGITVHYVDEGIDTGDVILQRAIPSPMQMTTPPCSIAPTRAAPRISTMRSRPSRAAARGRLHRAASIRSASIALGGMKATNASTGIATHAMYSISSGQCVARSAGADTPRRHGNPHQQGGVTSRTLRATKVFRAPSSAWRPARFMSKPPTLI
jgi:hypothetical protein